MGAIISHSGRFKLVAVALCVFVLVVLVWVLGGFELGEKESVHLEESSSTTPVEAVGIDTNCDDLERSLVRAVGSAHVDEPLHAAPLTFFDEILSASHIDIVVRRFIMIVASCFSGEMENTVNTMSKTL